jgi:hypothetical protein
MSKRLLAVIAFAAGVTAEPPRRRAGALPRICYGVATISQTAAQVIVAPGPDFAIGWWYPRWYR